jgi:hypothetical protein
MLSWNPALKPGKVGRMIEIYNPNPWETFGGMGSKKLEGDNIEYIANNDSHPGAQFNSEFRSLVKSEVAKFTTEDRLDMAQADAPKPLAYAQSSQSMPLEPVVDLQERSDPAADDRVARVEMSNMPAPAARLPQERPKPQSARDHTRGHDNAATDDPLQIAAAALAKLPPPPPLPPRPEAAAPPSDLSSTDAPAFLDQLSGAVNSGDLFGQRELTAADLKDYAARIYRGSPTGDLTQTASN